MRLAPLGLGFALLFACTVGQVGSGEEDPSGGSGRYVSPAEELEVVWGEGVGASLVTGCQEGTDRGYLEVLVGRLRLENKTGEDVRVAVKLVAAGRVWDLRNAYLNANGSTFVLDSGLAPGQAVRGTLRSEEPVDPALCEACGGQVEVRFAYEKDGEWIEAGGLALPDLMGCGTIFDQETGTSRNPLQPGGCTSDEECLAGCYCDPAISAACIETGLCETDGDCEEGQICDVPRATCRPPLDDDEEGGEGEGEEGEEGEGEEGEEGEGEEGEGEDDDPLITICHVPAGNPDDPQTITINESAWPTHEAHGDTRGACAGGGGRGGGRDDDGDSDSDDGDSDSGRGGGRGRPV